MTRETKIGLLVGLCFIIVIGILLSDHFRSTMEPPEAALVNAGSSVRQAVDAPGTGNPPMTIVPPADAPPSQQVPTHDELTPPVSPVVPSVANNSNVQTPAVQQPVAAAPQTIVVNPNNQIAGADSPPAGTTLEDAARARGEPLVPAKIDGTPSGGSPAPVAIVGAGQTYKAQSGDTVSRMAARFMGSGSRANVQAIIDANESLRDDPDTVIVGHSYVIPAAGAGVAQGNQQVATDAPSAGAPSTPAGQYVYTVQEGDSLWRIANDQLGDPSAVSALKELNAGVLKGQNHEIVTPGMRLRLPSKPIASAS